MTSLPCLYDQSTHPSKPISRHRDPARKSSRVRAIKQLTLLVSFHTFFTGSEAKAGRGVTHGTTVAAEDHLEGSLVFGHFVYMYYGVEAQRRKEWSMFLLPVGLGEALGLSGLSMVSVVSPAQRNSWERANGFLFSPTFRGFIPTQLWSCGVPAGASTAKPRSR